MENQVYIYKQAIKQSNMKNVKMKGKSGANISMFIFIIIGKVFEVALVRSDCCLSQKGRPRCI